MGLLVSALVAFGLGHMPPLPPVEYQNYLNEPVKITFYDPVTVHTKCGGELHMGYQIFACARVGGPWIKMPDPCIHQFESYARLLCHELGHTKGWPADHPNPIPYVSFAPAEDPNTPQTDLQSQQGSSCKSRKGTWIPLGQVPRPLPPALRRIEYQILFL